MTAAKLLTSPSEGHGLTDKQTNELYQALVDGKPVKSVIALVLLEPVGTSQRKTAKGLHRSVTFEAVRLEPVLESNQQGELGYLLQALYEQRTSTGTQRALPLGFGGEVEEKRHALLERIEDWSKDEGLTGGELETRWRDYYGIGDKDYSYGDHGVPGDYRKAGVQQLLEFGQMVGALPTGQPTDASDDADDGDDVEQTDSELPEGACQVCRKPGLQLTDGLCPECAKNAGLHVVRDEDEPARDGKSKAAGD